MHELNVSLLAVGFNVIILGIFSKVLKKTVLAPTLLALLFGVLLGEQGLGLVQPSSWGPLERTLEQAARFTIAIGLLGVALRIPPKHTQRLARPLAVLVLLLLPLMWLSSALLIWAILDVSIVVALLIGAVVSPTDPIVATTIVSGERAEESVPDELRHTILLESGANDGLAYPLVLLPILCMTRPADEVLGEWALHVVLWQIGGAVLLGVLLGLGAGRLLEWAESRDIMEQHSFLAFTLALTVTAMGLGGLMKVDDILAVFVAGVAFDHVTTAKERKEEEKVQEAVNQFFVLPIFLLLGAVLPVASWIELDWRAPVLVVAVLLGRRLPALWLLRRWIEPYKSRHDALFAGWFGPIGAAALFYAMLALHRTGNQEVWPVTSLLIVSSLVVHGMTAAPFTSWYKRSSGNEA